MNALVTVPVEPAYHSIDEIGRMANVFAKSGLFGVKTVEQAAALMLVAQADGLHPATVARDYDIIQGRPAKKAEAMLRDFIRNGGAVKWHTLSDEKADATFSHPQGGEVRIDWDMKRAKEAQLGGKDMWKKFPRQMLRSRVISEGIRTVCPMATGGMYVPEEVRDFAPDPVEPRSHAKAEPQAIDAEAVEVEREPVEDRRRAAPKPMCGALKAAKPHIDALTSMEAVKDWEEANETALRKLSNEDYVEVMSYLRTHEAKLLAGAGATDFGDLDAAASTLTEKAA